ncbi:MAG: alanine racemase [Sulfurovum sp.]|nr:alanine racemase [Sulfurovum sp.]
MAFITINKQHFHHNLNQIALQTGSVDKIAIVLKDNAYGHGLVRMATLASDFGIKHAVVRNIQEAQQIDTLFESLLILGDTPTLTGGYHYALNSLEDIQHTAQANKVVLKVDTGMHRNGIAMSELTQALIEIKARDLDLVGLMTHYRSADILSSEFFWQQKQFEIVKRQVKDAGFDNISIHSHNSASI